MFVSQPFVGWSVSSVTNTMQMMFWDKEGAVPGAAAVNEAQCGNRCLEKVSRTKCADIIQHGLHLCWC